MSQTINSDTAAMEAARREMQRILAALKNRRSSTDKEIKRALRMLGYNPKTVTVKGLCTCIYYGFYKAQTDIPKSKRNPARDCSRSTVFGHACYYLGLITDAEIQGYLWSRSGTMTSVNYQPVRLCEIVAYLNKRDSLRKDRRATQEANIAAKQERSRKAAPAKQLSFAESAAFADACVADEEGAAFAETEDDYAYESKVDRIIPKYKIKGGKLGLLSCLLNLMALPDSHPAKRELFGSD
jgi:hypothetical protein